MNHHPSGSSECKHGYEKDASSPTNGILHLNRAGAQDDAKAHSIDERAEQPTNAHRSFQPVAICGMACRLPGGVHSPSELWSFLQAGQDARGPVPSSRYNVSAYHASNKKPGSVIAQQGYFLDSTNDLAALDTTFFSMPRGEVETLDPQQRLLLEVAREALDDSGETGWKGSNMGVYVGSYGQDWYDVSNRDTQAYGIYQVLGSHDFMVSNRLSHEFDLHGPSVTIRTACSASIIGVDEACKSLARGECASAIVGGTNVIMSPALTAAKSEQGVLSPDGSCNTFSVNANGYARGEGVVAMFLKPLQDAIRDGNPIRAVVTGSAVNHNGHTSTVAQPSSDAQEALIRQAYRNAGIADIAKTGFFECHGTGTRVGDPLEIAAVSACFGKAGVHVGSIKANLGHTEGAAGLVGILKAVLALEKRMIPPSIKSLPHNPAVPFEDLNIIVPTEPTPWPEDRHERVSVNNFGLGGSNAHAIIESAASVMGEAAWRKPNPSRAAKSAPHLLLFSANTPESLQAMSTKYEAFLERNPDLLPDLSYTLARRREHLPYRTFAVCTSDKSTLAPPAPSKAQPNQQTSLVMVFTGQGAQWARMGYELLHSKTSPVFKTTIASLDNVLQGLGPLAPSWTIDEELRKPPRKSRVDEAEISQPLCTALQIGLVDMYASIGIRPAAVVGHSSGEMAAAYAAGGLSAREAIIIALLRGIKTKQQSRRGAMGALGLSWEAAKKYLVPGVVLACDNAPNSVTISGDAGPLEQVIKDVKTSDPGILATVLKVEKAYHSPHMEEIGAAYHAGMTDAGVVGSVHTVPFFSSVSGELVVPAVKSRFGPKYWQTNLERPVMFTSAIRNLIQQHVGPAKQVFLEVGPHAALSGPLRQIITQASSTASYIPTLSRRTDSAECWLSAVGQLFAQHVPFRLEALMPTGNALSDLPPYPWDHHRSYWKESRVAHEWRMRKHPHHDLLGAKVPETTDLEPVWRNLLHIENAPWIRHHKINADVVFPFSGYIAMAAEAIRQVSGVEEGVEFRNVTVRTALVINEGSPKELVTTLRRLRLTDWLDSEWWEFAVSSYNGQNWTKHCWGEARARETYSSPSVKQRESLPRQASRKRWYNAMRRQGLDYGYHFQSLEDITTSTTGPQVGYAQVRNNWHGDEECYLLHPVILDSYFQLLSIAARYGLTHDYHQVIPASVGSLILRRSHVDHLIVSAVAEPVGSGVYGKGTVAAGDELVIEVSGVRLASFINGQVEESAPVTARSHWVPCINTNAVSALLAKPTWEKKGPIATLDELVSLSMAASQRSACGIDVTPGLKDYQAWLGKIPARWGELDDAALQGRITSLATDLASTCVAPVAKAISLVAADSDAIFSDRKSVFDMLDTGDTLGKCTRFLGDFDGSAFLHCLGHNKPNLRILHLGAGDGAATAKILKHLRRPNGQALYTHLVVSDPSLVVLESLKARFQDLANVTVEALDIALDTELQGFEERNFDLIIASNVLQNTPNLSESLIRVRQLLAPSGWLLLQSLQPGLSWVRYVFGLLPSWQVGLEDGRADEPYVNVSTWQDKLATAGLEMVGDPVFDDQDDSCPTRHVLMVKQRRDRLPKKTVTILSEPAIRDDMPHPITKELISQGYQVSACTLADVPPLNQDVIVLVDEKTPFMETLDATKLNQLKAFVANAADSGILWVTQASQGRCPNPNFAQIHGLARCIRSELDVAFATCEVDDMEKPEACQAVVSVFETFAERATDGEVDPDYEYIIDGGVVRVNRFFPVSLTDEEAAAHLPNEEARLTIDHPGRLDTLHWVGEDVDAPQKNEVQVEIHAVGLNFRDVLVAMGIINLSTPTFGYEATGIVQHVGPAVEKLQVGDRVALIGYRVFASCVTTTDELCIQLPGQLDFTAGACMPLVFATAIYSVMNVGGLEKGQSILIHSGCGGVGLAAIQLARMIGAKVYTTVSNEEKAEFLVRQFGLSREDIFHSRSVTFEQDLLGATNGKGVDLAINSLSGELLHATWRCVAKWGTLVEIGKRDLLGGGKLDMSVFLANRSYRCVDIDQMCKERPDMIRRLLETMMSLLRQGHIQPIAIDKIFPASKVQEAFQYMQQGTHTGKIVLQIHHPTSGQRQLGLVQAASMSSRTNPAAFDGSASYLLVGGLGGLGRSVAVWMVQHGARKLTFLSRRAGMAIPDQLFVQELQSMGCEVHLVRGDVTEASDVARAVAESPRPLRGILQMAMVLRDQAWHRMSTDEWIAATAPKVRGTWNLHKETEMLRLDFFVLFSSLSGIVGQPGQANYASANTFLDAFAKFQSDKGIPCTSLNIGAVEGAGYLVENEELLNKMKGTGWRPVQESEVLDVLGAVIRRLLSTPAKPVRAVDETSPGILVNPNNTLVGIAPVIPLSSPDSSAKLRKDVRMSVFRNIRTSEKAGSSSDMLRQFLSAAKANPAEVLAKPESTAVLAQEIGKKLLGLVLRPTDEQVDVSLPLARLGLDSMVAVEMRAWWKHMFGLDISVLEMLSMGTLAALAKHAVQGLLAQHD